MVGQTGGAEGQTGQKPASARDKASSPPLLEEMRRSPQGDWSIEDVQTLCAQVGLACTSPSRGTHYKVSAPSGGLILTVPYGRPIKAAYIRKLVKMAQAELAKPGEQ